LDFFLQKAEQTLSLFLKQNIGENTSKKNWMEEVKYFCSEQEVVDRKWQTPSKRSSNAWRCRIEGSNAAYGGKDKMDKRCQTYEIWELYIQ
jgi:hypothetical protein